MANITRLLELAPSRMKTTIRASLSLGIVYLNVPKCGCTTVKRALWQAAGGHKYENKKQFDENLLYSFRYKKEHLSVLKRNPYVFTIVRNPFARIYSAYFDKIYYVSKNNLKKLKVLEKEFFPKNSISFKDFLIYIESTSDDKRDPHWRSMTYQTNFKYVTHDYIGCIENIQSDLENIGNIFGYDLSRWTQNQNARSSKKSMIETYNSDPQLVDMVLNIYHSDFLNFNYSQDIDNIFQKPITYLR